MPAVDAKHTLIVAEDVTHEATDRAGRSPLATAANAVLGAADRQVVADQGDDNGPEITVWAAADEYRCPAGEALPYRCSTVEQARGTRSDSTGACGRCALQAR